ncbi:hypothetical protein CVT25_007679 [Psilocybe cyanescens]|uniref:Arginyl-tRNA synthetase catalytic core domain-containing protein n=1 Tax=Psilocybe cyanescens TaxID=93625 RepID=A0A409XV94_PSICY|nr:hypothetical protein CVT25_007679 [Psilocybe cyanescens]
MASSVPPLPTVSSTDPSKILGELEETAAEVIIKHFQPDDSHPDRHPTCNVPSGLPKYGTNDSVKGKKVVIEYSSPNIAQLFYIGHLWNTIISAFLASKILSSLLRIFVFVFASILLLPHSSPFHESSIAIPEYPTDISLRLSSSAYSLHASKIRPQAGLENDVIKHLFDIYAAISKDASTDSALKASASNRFKRVEDRDQDALRNWRMWREMSVREYEKEYERLNVKFDKWRPGKTVVRKKDGTLVYLTRDIGGAITRYEKYKFDKMKYVVFSQQGLHLSQFFVVLELPLGVLAHAHHLPSLTRNEYEENGGGVFGQDH